MKRFKIFAVMIVLAVVAGTGVAKSGGGDGKRVTLGYVKISNPYFCELGFFDFEFDCARWAFGETCTIWGTAAYDDEFYCQYDFGSPYYAKRI